MAQTVLIPLEISVLVFTTLTALYAVGRMQEIRIGVIEGKITEWANILNIATILIPFHTMAIVLHVAHDLGVTVVVANDGIVLTIYTISLLLAIVLNTATLMVGMKFESVVHHFLHSSEPL